MQIELNELIHILAHEGPLWSGKQSGDPLGDTLHATEPNYRIVVAHHGFVHVGLVSEVRSQAGWDVVVDNALTIRRWGTTRGLGQLAKCGPTKKTELDPSGTIRIAREAVVQTLDCDWDWSEKCRSINK